MSVLPSFIRGEDQSWTFAVKDESGVFVEHADATVTAKLGLPGGVSVNLSITTGINDLQNIADDVPCWFLILTSTQSAALEPGLYKVQVKVIIGQVTSIYRYDVRVEASL